MTPDISYRSLIKSDYKFQDGGHNDGRARVWLYLKCLYFISSGIAYCISPHASFYAGLSCLDLPRDNAEPITVAPASRSANSDLPTERWLTLCRQVLFSCHGLWTLPEEPRLWTSPEQSWLFMNITRRKKTVRSQNGSKMSKNVDHAK